MNATIADRAPSDPVITDYDRAHLKLYLRLLDADAEQAAWDEIARLLLDVDPARDRDRARVRYETHLARARWMTDQGYLDLLKSSPS